MGTSGCGREIANSNQLQPLQTRMAVLPHDDVVVHRDAERLGDVDDLLRHLDVGARGRRIAGRVIVHQASARPIALITHDI